MQILYVTGASYPFLVAGENAYVAYSLPREIRELEGDVRVIMPKFSQIGEEFKERMEKIADIEVKLGWRTITLGVETLKLDGVVYYFLENEFYFNRDRIFGEEDDCERFAVFSKGVLESLKVLDWIPEVIHCNNSVSALVPIYLEKIKKEKSKKKSIYNDVSTLFTIHTLKHQGIVSYSTFKDILDLDEKTYFTEEVMKHYDHASLLKGAVYCADMVNTVSSNYLKEIMTPEGSGSLSGFFQHHKKKIVGIKNGIDSEVFDPKKDSAIVENYGYTTLDRRKNNKLTLQRELGLDIGSEIPVIAILSKLDNERGMELLKDKFQEVLKREVELVIIGSGEERYEDYFDYYSTVMPNRVFTQGFDFNQDNLSRKILSGADFLLVPSESEPCGIIQMLALRYGVVPIVRATGGLKETVSPETGFLFENFSSTEMLEAIDEGLKIYRGEQEKFLKIVEKGMRARNSWKTSAKKYMELFNKIKRG